MGVRGHSPVIPSILSLQTVAGQVCREVEAVTTGPSAGSGWCWEFNSSALGAGGWGSQRQNHMPTVPPTPKPEVEFREGPKGKGQHLRKS